MRGRCASLRRRGSVPDRGMVAAGGLLLVLPGILTDLVGLIMVIPASRPITRRLLATLGTGLVGRGGGSHRRRATGPEPKPTEGPIIQGEVLDSRDDPGHSQARTPARPPGGSGHASGGLLRAGLLPGGAHLATAARGRKKTA